MGMRRRYHFILIFLSLLMVDSIITNAQQILFKHFTVADGLCSNTIWAINQDKQGFMWVGTKGGLNRFDGYEFRKFQNDKSDTSTIGDNYIRAITEGKDGNFWIGTAQGIYHFDVKTEQFTRFKPSITTRVNDIMLDKSGVVWFATGSVGLLKYIPETGELKSYFNQDADIDLRSLAEDSTGKIWIGTYGNGIDVFDPVTSTIEHHSAGVGPGMLTSDFILTVYKSLEGVIWVGTLSGGLNYWDADKKQFGHYVHQDGKNSLSDNIVRAINQRKSGELLLGTEKGLNILSIKEQHFVSYSNTFNDPHAISDNAVWSIYVDQQKNIWAGTYFGGLNFVNMKQGIFNYYYPSQTHNSLSGKAVSSFLESDHGLWIGTEDGGLNFFNKVQDKFYRYPFSPQQEPLSYHNIHALFQNDDGKLWIGTFSGGLNIYDPATGKVKNYRHIHGDDTSISNNSIYSIYKDHKNRIWIGTVVGLNIYNPATDSFDKVNEPTLRTSVIYKMLEDKEGNFWVSTYGDGLFKKVAGTDTWLQYRSDDSSTSLSGNRVITLLEDSKSRLWIGTDGSGLSLFKKNGKFQRFTSERDFPLKTIYSILEDKHGNLWMSSNQGILCFNPETGRQVSFKEWDHLQSQQFNYGAGMVDENGSIYFGGINGYNTFHPDSILKYYDKNDYSIYFTNFQLFNQDVVIKPEKGILKKAINYTHSIILNHDQSVISFEFAGIDYISPHALEYSYRMEGFDTKWNEVGQQRKATYTNLPPGDFVFQIKASNTKGASVVKTTELKVTILPPLYQTRGAYLLYVILFVVLVFLIRRHLLKRADKRNIMQLERMKRKEERLFYKRKIEFFTEMAHEIRTPLSLIIAPLERLLESNKTNKETKGQLEIMDKNSDRLLSLINQLLDFRRIESDDYIIKPENVELVDLIRNIHSRFLGIAEQKKIKFFFSTDMDNLEVKVDVEAFTKILSNLLINAFKFARNQVYINVSKDISPDMSDLFIITVQDDGIGIPKKDINHIFNKFFKVKSGEHQYNNLGGTGIGLSLAKSLTAMHKGKLEVESDESSYTKFIVKIPYYPVNNHAQEAIPELSPKVQSDENAPKLLVVEDNQSMLEFLFDSFQVNEFNVFTALNGNEAVNMLKENDFDIVITDIMMPEMDGMNLCRHIKSDLSLSQIPVVLLTAKSDPEAEMEGLEIGADAYVHKPFKFKHLLLVINNLLKSRQLLKLKFSQHPLSDAHSITYNNKDERFMHEVIELIEKNISNTEFSIELLSNQIGLSRSGLHKKLKGISGIGPNEFIRLIRLKHAARLLKQGNYNISEVGYMSGFSSPSYFSKCFHEQFKKTPKEFISQEMLSEE